jgi:hypothetical protein
MMNVYERLPGRSAAGVHFVALGLDPLERGVKPLIQFRDLAGDVDDP